MKYLVTGNNQKFNDELIQNALEDLSDKDQILITASTIVEDQVARYAFEVGAALRTEAPDNALRGNSSRLDAIRNLAKSADYMVLFIKKRDKEINEIRMVGEEEGLDIREYFEL